jgi:hypothetical protein
MRITHIFKGCIYFISVKGPEDARHACRPFRLSTLELTKLTSQDAMWGRIDLPASMSNIALPESEPAQEIEAAWSIIEPLVEVFEQESNLHRKNFTALIRERANATGCQFSTVRRTLLRFYYFGRSRLGLIGLPHGTKPVGFDCKSDRTEECKSLRRRGRRSILENDYGPNTFVVDEDDINDMVRCLTRVLKNGPSSISAAHEEYLAKEFRARHPHLHADYLLRKILEPVTRRQFSYYVGLHAKLNADLAENLQLRTKAAGHLGSLHASGPGEVYEIDSTGGRLYLVCKGDNGTSIILRKPTIYLIVDRWSRFVVSVYLSLRPPSYEEVRQALLIAFTSREKRLTRLGVDVDDLKWPVGRMPAVLCPDRGSEFMSESMERAVVQDLRLRLTPLPPYCPDGKAIVERLIRELKRRMSASALKGTYAKRPTDPATKLMAQKARTAAVHSLAEAYRTLIDIVVDHNNRPHSALRRLPVLTQAGVPPTPKAAYLWGLKNITGLAFPPLTDQDYQKLLLASDKASIASGILRYKKRSYLPENEAAIEFASRSIARSTAIDIRLDKENPIIVFVVNDRGTWASFKMTQGSENELACLTLDEEDLLASKNAQLWALSDYQSRVNRVAAKVKEQQSKGPTSSRTFSTDKEKKTLLEKHETTNLKMNLVGKIKKTVPAVEETDESDWTVFEERERLRNLEAIRKHRGDR